MSTWNAVVVALSLAALAAAAQLARPTTLAAPAPMPFDDNGSGPEPGVPRAPILSAGPAGPAMATRPSPRMADNEAIAGTDQLRRVIDEQRRRDFELDRRTNIVDQYVYKDPVAARVDRATRALRRISDDWAIELSKLTDEDYRALQEEYAADVIASSTTAILPDRNPEDFSELLRQPIDLSELADASEEMREAVRMRTERRRRRLECEYRFEVARLRPESLREYANGLAKRRSVQTRADHTEFIAAHLKWDDRLSDWARSPADPVEDERVIGELLRTAPSRLWVEPSDDTVVRLFREDRK